MTGRYDKLVQDVENEVRLSRVLSSALRRAREAGSEEITTWIQLELLGYVNGTPGFTGQTVPEYRGVGGWWTDSYGRRLVVDQANLAFINHTRLRHGVAEIESFLGAPNDLMLPLSEFAEIINRKLKVEVSLFVFSPTALPPVLANIRSQLLHRLVANRSRLELAVPEDPVDVAGDIVELRPNLYGIGVDLRVLWRKWRSA